MNFQLYAVIVFAVKLESFATSKGFYDLLHQENVLIDLQNELIKAVQRNNSENHLKNIYKNFALQRFGLDNSTLPLLGHKMRTFIRKKRDKRKYKGNEDYFGIQELKVKETFWDKILYALGIKKKPKKKIRTTTTTRSTRRPYPHLGWVEVVDGTLPYDAFIGMYDFSGNPQYIGRGYDGKDVIPGFIVVGEPCVRVVYKGWGRCMGDYDVLVGMFRWVPTEPSAHVDKVLSGEEDGKPLYMCRKESKSHQRFVSIGKITPSGWCYSYFQSGQSDSFYGVYEVLVGPYKGLNYWNETRRDRWKDIRLPGEKSSESVELRG